MSYLVAGTALYAALALATAIALWWENRAHARDITELWTYIGFLKRQAASGDPEPATDEAPRVNVVGGKRIPPAFTAETGPVERVFRTRPFPIHPTQEDDTA